MSTPLDVPISALPEIIDALNEVAERTLTPEVEILDGPPNHELTGGDFIVIGLEQIDGTSILAATTEQDWVNVSRDRDEAGQVKAVLVAWGGNDTFKTLRDRAFGKLRIFATALREDPTLGLDPLLWCGLVVDRLLEARDPNGSAVHVQFSVIYRARI